MDLASTVLQEVFDVVVELGAALHSFKFSQHGIVHYIAKDFLEVSGGNCFELRCTWFPGNALLHLEH